MKDKGHFYASLIKSIVRIIACVGAFIITKDTSVKVLAFGLAGAELLGIAEEVFDKR